MINKYIYIIYNQQILLNTIQVIFDNLDDFPKLQTAQPRLPLLSPSMTTELHEAELQSLGLCASRSSNELWWHQEYTPEV